MRCLPSGVILQVSCYTRIPYCNVTTWGEALITLVYHFLLITPSIDGWPARAEEVVNNIHEDMLLVIHCIQYCTQEIFGGGKIELFTKIFLANIQIHRKCIWHMHWLAYLPNFSLPITFTCMVHQIFPMYGNSKQWPGVCQGITPALDTSPVPICESVPPSEGTMLICCHPLTVEGSGLLALQ